MSGPAGGSPLAGSSSPMSSSAATRFGIAGSRPSSVENMGPPGGGVDRGASGRLGAMPAPGDLLADRYRIVAPLGACGMATVHRAHDERLARGVAVNVLLPNLAADPVTAQRFEREARAMAAVAHPGLVAVFDVDAGDPATGRDPFVVMELCPGGSLADRMGPGRPLPPDELIPILAAVADALGALHHAGLVHRDV